MARRVVVVDNHDSFTHLLVDYLRVLGATCEVRLSDATSAEEVGSLRPSGILLSPGPGRPEAAGSTLEVIGAFAGKTPILGVCLGHQAIALHHGGSVRRARSPVHGKATEIFHDGQGVYRGLPNPIVAGRYHSLVADRETLPPPLTAVAVAHDPDGDELMGIRHATLAIEGIQFHPESVLSEQGHALLNNWLEQL